MSHSDTFLFPDLSEITNIDDYDATYTTDISRVKRPTNYSSLAKLFAGFFTFWADFDFSYYVICPKVGGVIPVEEFPAAFELKEGKVFTVSACSC